MSRHHSLLWKTMEKPKIRQQYMKLNLGSVSRLHVEKVSAPHNARPKTVPLIK